MARNHDEQAKQSAIQDAKREGKSPSAEGLTTGASKQIRTLPDSRREPKGDRKS